MKMFRKQTARAPLTTVLLVLLLALSIAASCIGFAAWAGGQKQFEAIDIQYTTIGILSGANYDKLLLGEMATFTSLDSLKFPDGTYYVGPESAKVTAQQSPHFISAESNILLSAHVADSTAITSAKLNGYDIGDSISLDYYDTGFSQMNYDLGGYYGRQGITVQRLPLTAENRMDIQKDYTIVGIYTAPEWTAGQHSFHADTIFVPKASVPGMEAYSGKSLPMLSAITIQNGSIDAFEAHMAANDKAAAYLYFDQGYTEAAATIQTLIDNAMRLMLVGVAMFLLASMLFLLLFARRVSSVMRSMRLLGVPKKGVWLESLGILVMQEVSAVILGNGLAVVLYDGIAAQLLSGTPALDITSIALCAGVQFALLVAAGGIWMHRIAGENLMQRTSVPKLKSAAAAA